MGTDDRSKGGEEWQTQKKKGWMAGQIRKEELLAKAVIIDGRKEWYVGLSFLLRDERLDEIEVSPLPDGCSFGVAKKTLSSNVVRKSQLV